MLSLYPFDISVGVGTFVIGLSQISSFFSLYRYRYREIMWTILWFFFSVCKHMSDGVFALLGTRSYASKDIIDSFTEKFHMPYLTTSVAQTVPHSTNYQIFMRPSLTLALMAMIKEYKWSEFFYLYDSDAGIIVFIPNNKSYSPTILLKATEINMPYCN